MNTADCDGQVLVCYDLLGLNPHFKPKFVKHYAMLSNDVNGAANAVLRPSDMSRNIVVGGAVDGAFNISAAMLAHLSGADQLVIGVAGSDGASP